ncbi:hypothetical protein AAF712_012354 [Marasmius tenuissimus]|uniref:Zn(2)-C6 fungal-type domain-containing protein n=1 Tax=Marasmius tenuissimus TaxID=585030 RepID=A0ABR2ZI35_9AGAR
MDSAASDPPLVQRHKRRGAALSCAECRRLKLKCSRVFPCSNCVKKGCGAICPEGKFGAWVGNRFVLANTEALHEKITQLATRVRTLEDALAQSHRQQSSHSHPLLSDELLQIKRPLERERADQPTVKETKEEGGDTIDAMGSLAISPKGHTTFFGQTANSWYLLQNEASDEDEAKSPTFEPVIPTDVPWLSYAFPFASSVNTSSESLRGSIFGQLPKPAMAKHLSDIYYRHAAWMYTPITQTEFDDLVFRPIYEADPPTHDAISSHTLAIIYMIMGIGTLLDLNKSAHSSEALHYYHLGRAALSIDGVFEQQSIPAIQALILMCHYMFLDHIDGPRWATMGLVVKLAQSVGLHRDSGKWNLDPEETFRRRCLLWEIYTYDSWQSLTYGRPPSFSLAHIDTKRPHETYKNAYGEVEMSFAAWKHGFCQDCLSAVHDRVLVSARPSTYKTIQEMDKKVRLYYVPPSLQVPGFGGVKYSREPEQPSTELTMQRYIAFAIKEITLFYMHRGFFARALEDSPVDPMGSKYAPSVLAAYTSACSAHVVSVHPRLFVFGRIVLGSIAAKAQMAIAPSALSHLESAYTLFMSVSTTRKNKILPVLLRLKERAHQALVNNPSQDIARYPMAFGSPPIKAEEDELAGLGGSTRLVSRRKSMSPTSPSSTASPPSPPSSSSPPPNMYQAIPVPTAAASSPEWSYTSIQQPLHAPHYPTYETAQDTSTMTTPPAQYHYPQSQHTMTLDGMSDYYGYNTHDTAMRTDYTSYHNGYEGHSPNDYIMPPQDISDSWQNLMAQYR